MGTEVIWASEALSIPENMSEKNYCLNDSWRKKRMEISITLNCFLFSVVFAGKLEREIHLDQRALYSSSTA